MKYKKVLFILFFLILSACQVFLLNSLSTYGSNINNIEKDITTISQENDDIEQSIASASSVTTLDIKAKEMGFYISLPLLSLQGPIPVAFSNPSSY